MKPIRFMWVLLISAFASAQGNGFGSGFSDVQNGYSKLGSFFNVVNSEPITAPGNPKQLQGSPFFNDNWMKGIITLSDGKSYSGERLKLDLLNTKLYFINQNGQEKVIVSPINRIVLLDSATGRVHTFVHSFALPLHPDLQDSAWLEVLQQGPAQLIKYHKKELVERSSYAAASTEQIKTQARYYLLYDGLLHKVNAFRDLHSILTAHNKELDEYINKQHPSWKKEEDIISVIAYYNSIAG